MRLLLLRRTDQDGGAGRFPLAGLADRRSPTLQTAGVGGIRDDLEVIVQVVCVPLDTWYLDYCVSYLYRIKLNRDYAQFDS
jgi:hypothetical protein